MDAQRQRAAGPLPPVPAWPPAGRACAAVHGAPGDGGSLPRESAAEVSAGRPGRRRPRRREGQPRPRTRVSGRGARGGSLCLGSGGPRLALHPGPSAAPGVCWALRAAPPGGAGRRAPRSVVLPLCPPSAALRASGPACAPPPAWSPRRALRAPRKCFRTSAGRDDRGRVLGGRPLRCLRRLVPRPSIARDTARAGSGRAGGWPRLLRGSPWGPRPSCSVASSGGFAFSSLFGGHSLHRAFQGASREVLLGRDRFGGHWAENAPKLSLPPGCVAAWPAFLSAAVCLRGARFPPPPRVAGRGGHPGGLFRKGPVRFSPFLPSSLDLEVSWLHSGNCVVRALRIRYMRLERIHLGFKEDALGLWVFNKQHKSGAKNKSCRCQGLRGQVCPCGRVFPGQWLLVPLPGSESRNWLALGSRWLSSCKRH